MSQPPTAAELRVRDVYVQRWLFGSDDIRLLAGTWCEGTFVLPPPHVDGTAARDAMFAAREWHYLPEFEPDDYGRTPTEDVFCSPVPNYATDIADAWRIVDEMVRRGFSFEMTDATHPTGYWVRFGRCDLPDGSELFDDAGGETAPLAIVNAVIAHLDRRDTQ